MGFGIAVAKDMAMSPIQPLEKIVQPPKRRRSVPWTAVCLGAVFVGAIAAFVGASAAFLSMTPLTSSEPVEHFDCEEEAQCGSTLIYATLLRSHAELLLDEESEMTRGARIVPAIKFGKAVGFKIYAVRPGSLLSVVGIRNGDTIHKIAGQELSSPDNALSLYNFLSQTEPEEIPIELTRDGCLVTMVVTLL
jgi:hypothetical protein